MCDPMKRAVRGALIFEGLANDDREAEKLITSKNVKLSPNHHHDSVGPMTGIISASMPVIITRDLEYGKTAYSTFNEGGGKVRVLHFLMLLIFPLHDHHLPDPQISKPL